MKVGRRRALIAAMRIVVDASEGATSEGLLRLFNAYNHLHRQLDGHSVPLPSLSSPLFVYDRRTQMVRTQ